MAGMDTWDCTCGGYGCDVKCERCGGWFETHDVRKVGKVRPDIKKEVTEGGGGCKGKGLEAGADFAAFKKRLSEMTALSFVGWMQRGSIEVGKIQETWGATMDRLDATLTGSVKGKGLDLLTALFEMSQQYELELIDCEARIECLRALSL